MLLTWNQIRANQIAFDKAKAKETTMPVLNTVHPSATELAITQENAWLKQRVAELEAKKAGKITYKVGEKGGISVYGLGRFPLTAYVGQWERLWQDLDNMKAFAKANASRLSRKE